MGNEVGYDKLRLRNFRLLARVVALIYIFLFSLFLVFMSVMVNMGKHASTGEYLIVASGGIYVIGLLTGLKWELPGAIISIGFLVAALAYNIYYSLSDPSPSFGWLIIFAGIVILSIPCILYFVYWRLQRRMEKKRIEKMNLHHIIHSIFVPPLLILIGIMNSHCEGEQEINLINCSDEVAIIKSISGPSEYPYNLSIDSWQKIPLHYYNNRNPGLKLKSSDSIFSKLQIKYFQIVFDTKSNIETKGDSLFIMLEPGDSMRIAHSPWLFYPNRIREPSLGIDNLMIITKSYTCIARSRKEILRLQRDKRFRYEKQYKDKVGPDTRENRKILIK